MQDLAEWWGGWVGGGEHMQLRCRGGRRAAHPRLPALAAHPRGCLANCLAPFLLAPSRQVEFSATKTICDVRVDAVTDARTGQPVKYGSRTQLATEGYHVE